MWPFFLDEEFKPSHEDVHKVAAGGSGVFFLQKKFK